MICTSDLAGSITKGNFTNKNVRFCIWWDYYDITHKEYLEKDKTILIK